MWLGQTYAKQKEVESVPSSNVFNFSIFSTRLNNLREVYLSFFFGPPEYSTVHAMWLVFSQGQLTWKEPHSHVFQNSAYLPTLNLLLAWFGVKFYKLWPIGPPEPANPTPNPISSPMHLLFPVFQCHCPPCSNLPGLPLPQHLCSCCSLCLKCSSPRCLWGWFPHFLHVCTQTSLSHFLHSKLHPPKYFLSPSLPFSS